jgi:hypothetical protein
MRNRENVSDKDSQKAEISRFGDAFRSITEK